MPRNLIRVAVFDDHALLREGIIHVLQSSKRFEVIGSGSCCADAVAFAMKERPDVIILDVGMPGGGIEAATRIANGHIGTRCIMLTISRQEDDVVASFAAGARAYVLKGTSGRELIHIVLAVYKGERYLPLDFIAGLMAPSAVPKEDTEEITQRGRRRKSRVTVSRLRVADNNLDEIAILLVSKAAERRTYH